jgi:hypothetical protein
MFLKHQINSKCLRLGLNVCINSEILRLDINSEWLRFGIGLKQKTQKHLSIAGFELATFVIRDRCLHPSIFPINYELAKPKPT